MGTRFYTSSQDTFTGSTEDEDVMEKVELIGHTEL